MSNNGQPLSQPAGQPAAQSSVTPIGQGRVHVIGDDAEALAVAATLAAEFAPGAARRDR